MDCLCHNAARFDPVSLYLRGKEGGERGKVKLLIGLYSCSGHCGGTKSWTSCASEFPSPGDMVLLSLLQNAAECKKWT